MTPHCRVVRVVTVGTPEDEESAWQILRSILRDVEAKEGKTPKAPMPHYPGRGAGDLRANKS